MAITRRQMLSVFSAVYLLALTALGVYALHLSNVYSLPIGNVLSALTIALPPLLGIAFEVLSSLQSSKRLVPGPLATQLLFAAFLVYEAVLATLIGTHLAPSSDLTCSLQQRWQAMYSARDGTALAAIQDAFRCCGFNSPQHLAFPFKDRTHGDDACIVRYERNTPCLGAWRAEERKVAGLLLVVPLAVFLWKVVVVFMASRSGSVSWLPSAIRLPHDGEAARSRPAIAYRDVEDAEDSEEGDGLLPAAARVDMRSSHAEGGRVRPSTLRQQVEEADRARRSENASNIWAGADEAEA